MGIFTAKKTKDKKGSTKVIGRTKKDGKDVIALIDKNKDSSVKKDKTETMRDLYAEGTNKDSKKGVKGSIAYRVLLRPLITEKATDLGDLNQYAFIISNSANKIEVAKAIFEVYGVKPEKVNIIKIKGKKVSRGRISGKRKDFKKAIITLKKGESISIYEGV